MCKIWGSYGSDYADYSFLRCDAAWLGRQLSTVWSNLLPPFQGEHTRLHGITSQKTVIFIVHTLFLCICKPYRAIFIPSILPSVCLSVHPSVLNAWNNSRTAGSIFVKFDIPEVYEENVKLFQFNSCREKWNAHLCTIHFPYKSYGFWDNWAKVMLCIHFKTFIFTSRILTQLKGNKGSPYWIQTELKSDLFYSFNVVLIAILLWSMLNNLYTFMLYLRFSWQWLCGELYLLAHYMASQNDELLLDQNDTSC
jgi:hypothetical protein